MFRPYDHLQAEIYTLEELISNVYILPEDGRKTER
jgi:hypothetical protein